MSDKVAINVVSSSGKEYIVWGFKGQSIYEALLLNNFDTEGSCAGRGTCGKCKVKAEGLLSEISDTEREMMLPEELKQNTRLACQAIIEDEVTVYLDNYKTLNKTSLYHGIDSNISAGEVKVQSFYIPGLDKELGIPIHSRIKEALKDYEVNLTPDNINQLLSIDRIGRPSLELQAVVFNNRIVKYVSRENEGVYGIALDLGSTSLFAALVDLVTGSVLAISSITNMQRIYGADIISRINYSNQSDEAQRNLQKILINNINTMIEEVVNEAGILPRQIYSFVAAGNPVMLHFFAGISVKGFGSYPYVGAFVDELVLKAKDIGLLANWDAEVMLLPQVGGFVGADTVAALLTLDKVNSCYLMVDIGTNGEIVLHKDGKMWATSAAAGPAFEGGHITCGVRAGAGSIDKVFLNQDEELEFHVIGEPPVRGLCGSAIIDLVACFLKANCIDNNGIIDLNACKLKVLDNDSEIQLVIYDKNDIITGKPIIFTQEDIRQVQLAKSAIRTAIDMLMETAKVSYSEIENIFLAGAFGNYINPVSAIAIGMLPPVDVNRVKNIGNAAGNGAVLALLSSAKRTLANKIAKNITYIELANHPDFQKRFLENINF